MLHYASVFEDLISQGASVWPWSFRPCCSGYWVRNTRKELIPNEIILSHIPSLGIPHFCHVFYTTAIWVVEILHLKVCKFATKVTSRQNRVNYYPRTQIMNCVRIMIYMLNCESNYTLCKIARWVKHYTMCKIAHSVKNYTQSTFFHVPCGKFYTWLKTFTQPAVVMVVTNMRCAAKLSSKEEDESVVSTPARLYYNL